jgi:subtilisin family serine protease
VSVNILLSSSATSAEIAAARSDLAVVYHESHLRQGIVVRGELLPGRLDALSQSSAVLWIERAPKRKLVDEAASKLVGGDDGNVATPTVTQQLGFDGTGVTVCVADTGLDSGDTNTMHPDMLGRVVGFQYTARRTDGSDGYGHGTHCECHRATRGRANPDRPVLRSGVASGANCCRERIFDDNANEVGPLPSDETLTRDAVRWRNWIKQWGQQT